MRGQNDPEPRSFTGWAMSGRCDQRGSESQHTESATEHRRGSDTPRGTGAEAPASGFPQDVGPGAGWVLAGDPGRGGLLFQDQMSCSRAGRGPVSGPSREQLGFTREHVVLPMAPGEFSEVPGICRGV